METSCENAPKQSRSARRRAQRKRRKAREKSAGKDVPTESVESGKVTNPRQRLRLAIQRKESLRSGKKQEILVPAPTPGELSREELAAYQKKMQKMVEKKGRGAILNHLGVTDKKTKVEMARAMLSGDMDTMNNVMKVKHHPEEDPALDE